MKEAAANIQWQMDLSSAVQDLLAAAVCVDVEDWVQAQRHMLQSQKVCDTLINALEHHLEYLRFSHAEARSGSRKLLQQ